MCLVEDIMNTLDDCDLLEKVVNMTSIHEHNDVTVSIKVQRFRSHHAKYVYYNFNCALWECHGYKHDCEPSRVPMKMLKGLSQKIRKLQSYVQSRLSKNVLKSSKIHDLIKNNATRKKSTHKTSHQKIQQKMRRKPIFRTRNVNSSMRYVYNSSSDKHGKKHLKYLRFFSCNFPYREYMALICRGNCTKNKLSIDIENLGTCMHHVDPSKTIKAPYSQGDVVVFGHHNMKGIGNPDVLKQIMHIENQLYSSLSQLSRQLFLLLTNLPSMLIWYQR